MNFIQPYDFNINIGKAYNEACDPLYGWICITDQDTLKFDGFAQKVKQITEIADKTQVITCMTNRLRKDNINVVQELYDESDINVHLNKYNALWDEYGTTLERTKMPIAGVFMLFHKTVWNTVKFRENDPTFDGAFSVDVRRAGFTTWTAKGLYIFHLYRWGRDISNTKHLFPLKYL